MENKENLVLFGRRLKAVRRRKGHTQASLAKRLGISSGNFGNWETGGFVPHPATLSKLAAELGVSVGYLLGEEPEQVLETKPNASAPMPAIEMFKGKVPVVSYATAGAGLNYSDLAEQINEWVSCDTSDPNAYALIIEGDSMEPEYKAGDRAVFLPNQEARNGDIVVARLAETGEVYFKLFHLLGPKADKVRLTSYNELYPPLEFPRKAFRFIHPLHGTWRPRKR